MASLFGSRRRRSPEDDGEGDRSGDGRVQRRCLSPEEDAASPVEAGAGAATGTSPGWLSSFVSGARKVFSSVLLFSSPEEGASEDEDDDGSEDGNVLSTDENVDVHDNHGAVVPYSESKLALEQMVMKETFARDECDRMVELIKSRVTDSALPEAYEQGTSKEIPNRNVGSSNDFTGAWRSLSRDRNFPESIQFSSMSRGTFSPGSPLQVSPELCSAAVKEAKKWVEEKRQGAGSKPEDNGPCTLNTDMFSSGFESDMGSPVDLAKSYMRSLPPWQSPFLGSQKFSTPLSGGIHIYDVEGKSKYSISSSKVTTKEDYISNFWQNLEESRRARIGSSGGSADASKFRHYGSTSRLFDNDISIFSWGTDEKVRESAQTTNGSDKVAATEPVNGSSIPITLTEDGNNGIVEPVDPSKDNGDAPKEYHASSEVHSDTLAEENIISPQSVTKVVTGHDGDVKAQTSDSKIGESHINSASAFVHATAAEAMDPEMAAFFEGMEGSSDRILASMERLRTAMVAHSEGAGSRLDDAVAPVQTSMNGSTNKAAARSLPGQSNANSGLSSGNENPNCTNSSSAVPPISSNDGIEVADGDSHENGVEMNPEEPAKEASNASNVRRGRKRVARGTRARGR